MHHTHISATIGYRLFGNGKWENISRLVCISDLMVQNMMQSKSTNVFRFT